MVAAVNVRVVTGVEDIIWRGEESIAIMITGLKEPFVVNGDSAAQEGL